MSQEQPGTKKYREFVQHPRVEFRSVNCLPGIGYAHRLELESKGYWHACEVLEKFKRCRYSTKKFGQWLESVCPTANRRHIDHCVSAMAAIRTKF